MSLNYMMPLFPLLLFGLVFAGAVIVLVGMCGRPVLTAPRCAKCNYDLRALPFMTGQLGPCPECGADLTKDGSVTFGKYRRRPKQVMAGLAMIVVPLALVPLLFIARSGMARRGAAPVPTPGGVGAMTTPQLIAALGKGVNTPWEWQELDRRKAAGTLGKQDIDQAIVTLIAYLNAQRAPGRMQDSLPWAKSFVEGVLAGGDLSAARTGELLRAFYGVEPAFRFRDTVREGELLNVDVQAHTPWNLGQTRSVYALGPVTTEDGTVLAPASASGRGTRATTHPDQFSGVSYFNTRVALPMNLPPGRHELTFTTDVGVVATDTTFRGLDGKPGTADKWPNPTVRWRATTRRAVTVVPKDQPIVEVVSDPAADPFRDFTLGVDQAMVRPSSQGLDLLIKWKSSGTTAIPLAYRVTVVADVLKFDYGTVVVVGGDNGSAPGGTNSARANALPAHIRSVDIVLTPDATTAESYSSIRRIWGGGKTIKGVPLQRYDVDAGRE